MADIVEPSSSASSISSLMQNQQQAVNLNVLNSNIIPILSDIQVETASSQSNPRPPPINQSANNNNSTTNDSADDEPEHKRKKIDSAVQPSTSQTNEKLESRLGGILCCAVCLDLPKTAMYQVCRTKLICSCFAKQNKTKKNMKNISKKNLLRT